MPFRFRKTFHVGPVRFNLGKRGFTSLGVGRTTFRAGYTPRTSIPTGISGLQYFARSGADARNSGVDRHDRRGHSGATNSGATTSDGASRGPSCCSGTSTSATGTRYR